MADKRISQLIERVDIANNDVLPIVAIGATTTNKVTISTIQDWMQTHLDTGVTSIGITLNSSGTDVSISNSPITSSGNITLSIPTASATNRGVLSAADWSTFNNKQNALGYTPVPTTRTITINGTSYDLSADRSWTIGSVTEAQNLITEVYNETGATLTKGTIVYINGGHGNLPTVTKALATGDSTSAQTYGIVQTDITNNNNGYVIAAGRISNLDTQSYSAGTQLYLSGSTAGTWTSTKPYAPIHLVYVGVVVRSHPTQGIVEVKIQNGYELDELHNVSAQTPSNNDGIFYNTSTSLWENKSIGTALGYTPANDSLVVHLAGTETITGIKTFSNSLIAASTAQFNNGVLLKDGASSASSSHFAINSLNSYTLGFLSSSGRGADLIMPSTGQSYTLPNASGTIALTSDIPSLSGYVTLATTQTITGDKTFDGTNIYTGVNTFSGLYQTRFRNGISLDNTYSGGGVAGYTTLGSTSSGLKVNLSDGGYNSLNFSNTTSSNTYTFPNETGTIALLSHLLYYVPTSRTLTINGTTYDLSADRAWTVSGSQWTTSGSNIYYNTGNVGIGTSSPSFAAGVGLSISSATRSNLSLTDGSNALNIFQDGSSAYFNMYSTGDIIFRTTTSNAERMRITSGGNVGIGTSSPERALDIRGGSAVASHRLQLYNNYSSVYMQLYTGGDGQTGLFSNSFLTFNAGSSVSEAMRITSDGFLKASSNGSYYGLYDSVYEFNSSAATSWTFVLRNMSADPYGLRILYSAASPNNGSNYFIYCQDTTTARYTLTSNGSASSSDERLKKNIETTRDGYLEDLCKLRVVKYNWFNQKDEDDKLLGLIAQEVEKVFPKLIQETESTDKTTTYKMIKDSVLPYMLLKALQEQQTQIEQLKAQIK